MSDIIKKDGIEILEDGMMGFSAYTLLQRAIPSLEDGLKISYRRILYSMYKNKVFNLTKSLNIVGEVAKIHPHGSVYSTVVGMAQKDRHIIPFLEGKGNFGSYVSRDDDAAADRYTSVKLQEFSKDMMKNLHKGSVKMLKAYDGITDVPEFLPTNFPTILSFAQSGMGVGFSSTTASFNVEDISNAVIHYLKTGKHINLIPDFATGGELLKDDKVINSINKKGKGTLRIRGKATIEGNEISITEIPYSTTKEAIIDKIIELAKTDKLSEVTNVQDLTGFGKMEILVTARKNTDMELLLQKLYELTQLQSTYSVNSVILVDGLPKLVGVNEMIERWVSWRKQCIAKELDYDIKKLEDKIFEVRVLEKLDEQQIKKLIEIIRETPTKTVAIENIRKINNFTFKEAELLYELKINQLNSTYINKKIKEKNKIDKKIEELQSNKNNPKNVIIKDMEVYKRKYKTKRRTIVTDFKKVEQKRKEYIKEIKKDLVDQSDYWITITKNHYIYKTTNKLSSIKGDTIRHQYKLNNAEDEVFAFTHSRKGYKLQIKDLEIYSGSGLGEYLPAVLKADKKDIIDYGISSKYFPNIILILTKGRIVKFNYETYRSGVNVFANTHTNKYELTKALFLQKDKTLQLIDNKGNKNTINTKNIRTTKTRTGTGQYIHSSRRDDIKTVK